MDSFPRAGFDGDVQEQQAADLPSTNFRQSAQPLTQTFQTVSSVTLDASKYREFLANFDLSEKEKNELIHTVYVIMTSFVEQAFDVHPMQLAREEFTKIASNRQEERDTLKPYRTRRKLLINSDTKGLGEDITP